jgi:FixJ family two-component response regulator
MENRASIAVVDDDEAVLRSMTRLLRAYDFTALAYESARALLNDIERVSPDCIIADLAMPDLSGLDLQRTLSDMNHPYPIVFISGHGDIRSSVVAMRFGAADFLPKPIDAGELLAAVQRAIERRRSAFELECRVNLFHSRLATLTRRERDVFELVVSGQLNKQIAAALGIAEKTVKVHRGRVMRKMSVRSVAALARIAERMGITESMGVSAQWR